jgi:hypothetical protein
MKLHPEELALSHAFAEHLPFDGLTDRQLAQIQERGRGLFQWFKKHPYIHNTIGVLVFAVLFGADYWALLRLPRLFLPEGQPHSTWMIVIAAALAGGLHSYFLYSMAIYSVHEAFTHKVLFQRVGPISRGAHFVASHLCRVAHAEPNHYSVYHLAHHGKFGGEDDGEFLNFVRPKRYWLTWLPLAVIYSDFSCHHPKGYNRSRAITALMTVVYNGIYGYLLYQAFGPLFVIVSMVLFFPHVGFILDRARQFTEHNLMPPENRNGSRSFGWGFWGMFLGGGPWGTPCHLEHHLVDYVPWYHQLILHAHVRKLLTPGQRKQFLIEPVIGWPKLWWRIMREHYSLERKMRASAGRGYPAA